MKVLKETDLTQERAILEELKALQAQLQEKAHLLEQQIDEKAREYYGDGGWSGYRKQNSHSYTTEDGYTVKVEDYQLSISKQLPTGIFSGYGTIYGKLGNDLRFSIHYSTDRYCDGNAKKYEAERQRIKELQDAEKIFNPFREFEDSRILSFFNNKYMN